MWINEEYCCGKTEVWEKFRGMKKYGRWEVIVARKRVGEGGYS